MADYHYVYFDLYNTINDDTEGYDQREKYRIDTMYSILEKSLFPVRFGQLSKKYGELTLHVAELNEKGFVMHPFDQVGYILKELNVRDIVIYKKVYDAFVDAIVQIAPKPMHNAEKALAYLKENGCKVGLISNTG
jgi:FMN phosphatase YigB (HAD superfamily)